MKNRLWDIAYFLLDLIRIFEKAFTRNCIRNFFMFLFNVFSIA